LGTRDALLWYHLATVEADLGMTGEARDHLTEAFAVNPYLTVRDAPAARRLAASLGLQRLSEGEAARARPAGSKGPR
ncbi:MAG TPA: hypothetical protein VII47_00385, partial [Actinomycetota bacterium]